jgi:signal transduction histidine kinase
MTTPRPAPSTQEQLPPALDTWSRTWRYLLAVAVGAAAWLGNAIATLVPEPLTTAQRDRAGAALFLDLVVGIAVVSLLPLRRRYPLAVAGVAVAASVVSAAGVGAMAVALVSMATWRRRWWVVVLGAASVVCATVSEVLYRPWFSLDKPGVVSVAGNVAVTTVIFAVAVMTGFYIGARRELFVSMSERALTAEREQVLAAQSARDAERTRIAREMHDDLAHRISLVALHAGALTYREDLTRAETAAAAQTIQTNARLALTELRQVLGVLRAGSPDGAPERSQPTLAELPALLADAREAGAVVRLDFSGMPAGLDIGGGGGGGGGSDNPGLGAMPETLSRTSFRVVQEGLTNARRHSPGQPVDVRLTGGPGTHLAIEIRNPIGVPAGVPLPSAGVGLAGLGERAELAGGTIEYGPEDDGDFVLRAKLPWPA